MSSQKCHIQSIKGSLIGNKNKHFKLMSLFQQLEHVHLFHSSRMAEMFQSKGQEALPTASNVIEDSKGLEREEPTALEKSGAIHICQAVQVRFESWRWSITFEHDFQRQHVITLDCWIFLMVREDP